MQSAGSARLVSQTLALAKLAGVSGFQTLRAQPALVIAIPTISAMFFYGCGAVFENSTIRKFFFITGDVLAIPIKSFEIMRNSYGNYAIQKVFGFSCDTKYNSKL